MLIPTKNQNSIYILFLISLFNKLTIYFFIIFFSHITFPQKGELKYGEEMYIESYDPITSKNIDNYASFRLSHLIYEQLVYVDNQGNVLPLLAEKWSIIKNGYKIKFFIRNNIKWHDGKFFSLDDVIFTFNSFKDKQESIAPHLTALLKNLDTIYISEGRSIVFEFNNFEPDLMRIFSNIPILPKHIFSNSKIEESILFQNPIGTGPFKFEFRSNDRTRVRLVAFESYYDKINISRITAFTNVDPELSVLTLLTKSIDLKVQIRAKDIARLETEGSFEINAFNSLKIYLFSFNFNNPLLKNINIRKAMVYGFNRLETFNNIYLGKGVLLSGPFSPGSWGYNPNVKVIPFDTIKANDQLQLANCLDTDGDGIRELNKKRLQFELLIPVGKQDAGDDFTIQVADIFKSQMKRIGIEIIIRREEWRKFLSLLRKKEFDIAYHSIVFDEKSDISPYFFSKGNSNFSNYVNQEVDKLFELFFNSNDPEQLRTIYYRLHYILANDLPAIFLWTPEQFTAYIRHKIRGDIYFDPFKFFTPKTREWIIDEKY